MGDMPKEKVDLIKTDKNLKKEIRKKRCSTYFKAPIVQKNSSNNYYLPERGIFSLPILFVNYFYNFAVGAKVTNNKALEHFLTKVINVEELLKLVPQRDKEADNQSRRLHRSITHLVGNKKEAEKIINSKTEGNLKKLNELVMKSVGQGKTIGFFNRIKDLKEGAA